MMKLGEQERRELTLIRNKIVSACQYCAGKSCPTCTDKFMVYPVMAKANLPKRYWNIEMSDIDDPSVTNVVTNYVKNLDQMLREGTGLFFVGQVGTGKSLGACLILKEVLRRGYTGYFTTLASVVTKCFNKMYDQQLQEEFRQNILNVDFLVLDDIDKAYKSEKNTFIDSAYDELFRQRYYKCLPILVTSNVKRAVVFKGGEQTFGQALLSIAHETMCDVIVAGKDRREQKNIELRRLLYG
jgi:DNA replication protein DnaC